MMQSKLIQTLPELVDDLKKINISILRGRLERGNILKRIKESKSYINYDSYCSNWNEFLEAVGINRETARQDMEIYEQFSYYLYSRLDLMTNCSYERLVRLLPVVKSQKTNLNQTTQQLLEMAAESNRTDFDNNIRELKGQIPSDMCEHEETITLIRCVKCGFTIRKKD